MAIVIAIHGSYCSVLILDEDSRESRNIHVNARGMKYTESGFVQYKFRNSFIEFVRTLTEEEFEDVAKKVASSLKIECSADTSKELAFKQTIKRLHDENEVLKEQVEKLQDAGSDSAEVIKLTIERDLYKQQYEKLLERLIGA